MTVKKRRDDLTPKYVIHKVADVRGGVSVAASELGGNYLREGAVLSAPVEGITHVVKTGEVVAEVAAADKTIKVSKFHNFKVGDIIMTALNGAAHAITAIDESSKKFDTITVKTALGAIPSAASSWKPKPKQPQTPRSNTSRSPSTAQVSLSTPKRTFRPTHG